MSARRYRVAVIGHTGRGNYGHRLDEAFVGFPRAELVAVSDPDEEGREACRLRIGAARAYASHDEMLAAEQPDVVVVAPRHVDRHREPVLAAIAAGAHVYCEKPLARSVAEADEMLAAARAARVRVGHALPFAYEQRGEWALRMLRAGLIGDVLTMSAVCKCDHRGGGQDFAVLGPHFADMMRRIAGDPVGCSADVRVDGRAAGPGDAREGDEGVGLVAGDAIVASYRFAGGIGGTISTWRLGIEDRALHPYRLDVHGSRGVLSIRAPYADHSLWYAPEPFPRPGHTEWTRLPAAVVPNYAEYHKPAAVDLIAAIEEEREPVVSGADGRAVLAMLHAAYASAVAGAAVDLPAAEAAHPLEPWVA